jgi:hypothetical protein
MHERAKDLLKLGIQMQNSAIAVSLDDIQAEFAGGRRTAERMRDAVAEFYGDLERRNGDDPSAIGPFRAAASPRRR